MVAQLREPICSAGAEMADAEPAAAAVVTPQQYGKPPPAHIAGSLVSPARPDCLRERHLPSPQLCESTARAHPPYYAEVRYCECEHVLPFLVRADVRRAVRCDLN
mmetsp:Transcript_19218/g.49636  ORF Transcript_19218/g.49636 Transcript_19218/m.49636 type:complete len:105 (-) Transcript_19218:231-545(-)